MRAATQATAAEFAPASRPDGGDAFSNAPTSRRAAALRDVAESELLAGSVASSPALRALVAFLGASRLRAEALRSPGVDLRPALALAERATSSAPRQRLPYQLLRLELLAKTGRTDEAVDAARLLRSVWPHSATALGRAAGLLLDAGALDEALALAEEAARLAPHDRFARYALGGVLVMTGRVADGLAQLDAAIDGAPTPRLLSARGAAYFFLGRFDEAERELTAAVAEGPLQSVAWNNLSALRLERGDYAGAVEAAEIALKLSPHKASAHANLGTAWSSLRRFGEAEIALRRARELAHESPESDARYAAVLMALGRKEEALALARAAAARAPNDDETQFAVARVFVDGGFAAEAVGLLTPMLARGPRGVQKHVVLAKAYLALGRRGEAEGVLEEAMRLAPRDAEVRYVHVAAALQAKDAATAVARAEEAVRVAPQSAVAWEAAAIARLEHGDTAAGIAAVRRGLEAEPARPNLLRTLAAALFREGRYAEAAEAYRGFVAAAPDDPRAHRGFLDAALRARTVDPLPEFRRWSERRPNDLAAKVDLARALLRSAGDAGVAGATTRPGSAAQPSAAPDAAAEAVALCEEVVRLGKGARIEFDGTVALGEALLAVGRRHGARDALERAERLAPPTDTRSDAVRGLTRLREALDEE
jgi:tetratricopeptide (TPR) repeat protein